MGCSVYVLDPRLQDEKKLLKWRPRTRKEQYLGMFPNNEISVGLTRNLNTGFISPQFHVIYNSKFQTVTGEYENNDAVVNYIWDALVHEETDNILSQAQDKQEPLPYLCHDWSTHEEQQTRRDKNMNDEVIR